MSPAAALRCTLASLACWNAQGFIDKAAPHAKARWSPITAGLPYKFDDVDLDEAATLDVRMREADGISLRNMSTGCAPRRPHFLQDSDCMIFQSQEKCEKRRRSPTYLATYPGSGNTWMRVVLEGTLQVYSGSVFHDGDLRVHVGMLGEGNVNPEEVLPIKTHWPVMGDHSPGGWNLCILRDPLHAALSWTSFSTAGKNHSEEVSQDLLRIRFSMERVKHLQAWRDAARRYRNCANCKVVRFEDIVSDTRGTYVREILPYLDVDTAIPEVISRLDCSIERSNANHDTQRSHSYTFEFTPLDKFLARRIIGEELMGHFGYEVAE